MTKKFYPKDVDLNDFLQEIDLEIAVDKLTDICELAEEGELVVLPPIKDFGRPILDEALRVVREQGFEIATTVTQEVFFERRASTASSVATDKLQAA